MQLITGKARDLNAGLLINSGLEGKGGEGRKTGKTDENAIAIVQTMGAQTGA